MMTGQPGSRATPAEAPESIAALKAELARLREVAALRDDIESIARHDLKAPLALILGAADLLADLGTNLTEPQKKQLGIIRSAGRRMLDMLDLSRDLAAIETGKYILQPAPVDLMDVLGEVLERHRVLAKARKGTVTIRVDGQAPASGVAVGVIGDRRLTTAVMSALIKNALEGSPSGGEVRVDFDREPGRLRVSIHNSGAVPEAVRGRFFQKYIACGKTECAGLGTYIARRCAEAQGGSIALDASAPGATTVIVRLPA